MFPYIGGKFFQAKHISSNFPIEKICTYVEPFSGAFWVYFVGNFHSENTIYNDINPFMCNIFSCASNDPEKLYNEMIKYKPQDKELFNIFKNHIFSIGINRKIEKNDFDLAVKYLYLITQIYTGNTLTEKSKLFDLKEKYYSKYNRFADKLIDSFYQSKLLGITKCENLLFQNVIEKYDNESTLFYCDPPYYNLEDYYTCNNCNHELLSKTLNSIKGKFVLSYYDFPLLDKWYPKNKFRRIYKNFNNQNARNGKKKTELLILNY